jgi:hypothetical protein
VAGSAGAHSDAPAPLWVEIAETKKEIQKWELEDHLNFAGVLLSI